MNFLVWYNPFTWGDDVISNAVTNAFDSLEGLIMRGIRQLFFWLNTLIYDLIIKLYNMFETLCSVRLMSSSLIGTVASRIGMVLGIVMLFNVVLAFIKMLIDPDTITDKNNGAAAVIKKVLIVIVMLGVSNFVFDTLYYVQYAVINSGAISKILLPKLPRYDDGTDEGVEIKNFGGLLAEETFSAFYYVDPDLEPVEGPDGDEGREKIKKCSKVVEKFRSDMLQLPPSFDMGNICLNEYVAVKIGENDENESEEFIITFNVLLATAAGIGIAYFIFMYCIQVGIRMIQLMVLEVISPMAFISYLSPKQDTMFSKWFKIYIATYIDVFVRVAIINFITMLISALFTTEGAFDGFSFWNVVGNGIAQKGFYIVVMILALLAFAKKAPELMKELLPASASKLGFGGMSMKDFFGLGTATRIGAGVGAAVGMEALHGNLNPFGYLGAAFRGGKAGAGAKGLFGAAGAGGNAERDHRNKVREVRAQGGSYAGYLGNQLAKKLGFETTAEEYDNQINDLKRNVEAEQTIVKQEQERTAMMRSRNEVRAKAADKAHNLKKRGATEMYTRDFSKIKDTKAKNNLQLWQRALNAQKAKIEQMQSMGGYYDRKGAFQIATPKDIAKAKVDLSVYEDKASRVYADYNSKLDFDKAMTSEVQDLQEMINANKNRAFDDIAQKDVTDYKSLDDFETQTLTENRKYSQEIADSDTIIATHEANIAGFEAQISDIQSSNGYRASQANKPK